MCSICRQTDQTDSNPIVNICELGHLGHRECIRNIYEEKAFKGLCVHQDNRIILIQNIYSPFEILLDRVFTLVDSAASYAKWLSDDIINPAVNAISTFTRTKEDKERIVRHVRQNIEHEHGPHLPPLLIDLINLKASEYFAAEQKKALHACAFAALTIYALANIIL